MNFEKFSKYEVSWPSALVYIIIIKLFGAFFATEVFSRFSPLIDANYYLQGFYYDDAALRTRLIQHIVGLLSYTGGDFFSHFMFGLVSSVGIFYFYFSGGRGWLVMSALLFPSALIWTSIISKEAIYFGFFSLSLVIWSRFCIDKLSRIDYFLLAIAVVVCGLLRPHYTVAIFWLFGSAFLLKKIGWKSAFILAATMAVFAVCVYFTVWDSLLLRGFGGIEPTARSSRFEEFGISQDTGSGFERYKSLVPLGVLYGVVGPMPGEVVNRIEFAPFFVEGVLIMFAPLLAMLLVRKLNVNFKLRYFLYFVICIIPCCLLLMVLHAPFGLMNPGSAVRWRVNFEAAFYLAPMLLYLQFKDAPSS
ncbi:hypothetical protein [Pusillimonas minor]|uniref:Glycosyltransferase RgtA/B/C/D-like domain-containing protein n=1 Tax=Pusillimonas minor TaxID=2697024 RepID=A0A842HQL1_9BURK|nr:hypothetical protein [Pusillimonas minor]MBC2770563.1 hypothetical protein [Pusillimonas minor]